VVSHVRGPPQGEIEDRFARNETRERSIVALELLENLRDDLGVLFVQLDRTWGHLGAFAPFSLNLAAACARDGLRLTLSSVTSALYHATLAWLNVKAPSSPSPSELRDQPMPTEINGGKLTLAAESRALASARILRAAMTELAAKGVDVTVDEIAAAAGVSRRTVFRHFATHGQLLAAASTELWRAFEEEIPGPPGPNEDLETWLTTAAITLHDLNGRILGQAFWGLRSPQPGGHAELSEWRTELFVRRTHRINNFSSIAWRAAGGADHPPSWVVDAFALLLSSFASNGLAIEGGRPPADTGRVCARILLSVLRSAIAETWAEGTHAARGRSTSTPQTSYPTRAKRGARGIRTVDAG